MKDSPYINTWRFCFIGVEISEPLLRFFNKGRQEKNIRTCMMFFTVYACSVFYGCWFNGWCFSFCYKMFTEQLKEESRHNIHRVLSGCHFIHYVRVSLCRRCSCFSLYNLHLTSSPFSGLLGRVFKHTVFTHWLYVSYSILNRVNITPSRKETKPAQRDLNGTDVWISLDNNGLICDISLGLVSRPHWRIHGIFLADTRIAAFLFYLFVCLFIWLHGF